MKMLCPNCMTECYGDGLYMVLLNEIGGPLGLDEIVADTVRSRQACMALCRRCAVKLRGEGYAVYRRERKELPK